jgi:murein DD-endopeptidase MepM/ murein hydrolase activator NlpD
MSKHSVAAVLLLAGLLPSSPAMPQAPACGDTVVVLRGDTLSRIAERCDVSESQLLRANPQIQASRDLRVGTELRLSGFGDAPTADRLRSFAREAADALSALAQDLGSSAEDLLKRNPDLQQWLRNLGERLNVPPGDLDKARITVSPQSGPTGTAVTVSGVGMPPNTPVTIAGGGPHAAYEVLDRTQTSTDGTLQATLQVPDWAGTEKRFVFIIIGTDPNWKARSSPFEITGTKL